MRLWPSPEPPTSWREEYRWGEHPFTPSPKPPAAFLSSQQILTGGGGGEGACPGHLPPPPLPPKKQQTCTHLFCSFLSDDAAAAASYPHPPLPRALPASVSHDLPSLSPFDPSLPTPPSLIRAHTKQRRKTIHPPPLPPPLCTAALHLVHHPLLFSYSPNTTTNKVSLRPPQRRSSRDNPKQHPGKLGPHNPPTLHLYSEGRKKKGSKKKTAPRAQVKKVQSKYGILLPHLSC